MRLGLLAAGFLIAACGARDSLDVDGPVGGEGGDGATGNAGGEGATGATGGGGGDGGSGVGGVDQLALGAYHSCIRTFEGEVYCWGENSSGQLGTGSGEPSLTPVRVPLDRPSVYLASGTSHTCAVLDSGDTVCWGKNDSGQIGDGSFDNALSPRVVAWSEPQTKAPVALALGEKHSCAIARVPPRDAQLLCWGGGESGQIGPGGSSATPVSVASGVSDVAAGAFHTCFVDAAAQVLCLGENGQKQCGVTAPNSISSPTLVEGLLPADSRVVRSGRGQHSCSFGRSVLQCWGENDDGQLAISPSDAATPAEGAPVTLDGLVDVRAGYAHTCALAAGTVYCWGNNNQGQLGTAGGGHAAVVPVPGATGMIAIGVGTLHTCAMRSPTEIFCWGGNSTGQLGDGTTSSSNVPVEVKLP